MRLVWGWCAILVVACGGESERDRDAVPSTTEDPTPLECDVVVPDDYEHANDAIAAAPEGGLVCLRPGMHPGPVVLRDGVRVKGIGGPGPVIVCCGFDASAATTLGSDIEALGIYGHVTAENSVKLGLHQVNLLSVSTTSCDCAGRVYDSSEPVVEIQASADHPLRFTAIECETGPRGFAFVFPSDGPIDAQVSIRRSQCVDVAQCYDFATFDTYALAPGSRLDIELENNLVPYTVLEAFAFGGLVLAPEDAPNSEIRLINNTIHSDGDRNYGVAFWPETNANVIVANNAIANLDHPFENLPPGAINTGNVTGYDSDDTWFQEGFRPKVHVSPLIGAADPAYLPADDLTGDPRAPDELESGALRLLDIPP